MSEGKELALALRGGKSKAVLKAALNAEAAANAEAKASAAAAQKAKKQRLAIVKAVEKLGLSARAFVKVLRVARTIADLEGEERVRAPHVAEAIQGRLLDREIGR